ncbi:MAG TPA: sigma-70 family RNA polymerase sigma factor [Solirubrobacteraceae bacterium]|jgi:RNA polymerase sigma factor (sigma-70 family)
MVTDRHISKLLIDQRVTELRDPGAGQARVRRSHLAPAAGAHTGRHRLPEHRVERLVHRAARGEQRAWDTLVNEFSGMIWAVARAHRLHDANAADVAQVTWIRLLEHLTRIDDPACVGAWLATTARRECLRVIRDSNRSVPCGDDAPEQEARDVSPGEALLINERDGALWRAFSQLRPSDQALLRLLMADPRPPYEEIAAALDMPIGSIGPTRQRALVRLRRELDRQGTLNLMTA